MRNVLERASQITRHSVLTARDLELQCPAGDHAAAKAASTQALFSGRLTLRELEARYIESVLKEEDGSIDRAARRLGISRSSLYGKVKTRVVERPNCDVREAAPLVQ